MAIYSETVYQYERDTKNTCRYRNGQDVQYVQKRNLPDTPPPEVKVIVASIDHEA